MQEEMPCSEEDFDKPAQTKAKVLAQRKASNEVVTKVLD